MKVIINASHIKRYVALAKKDKKAKLKDWNIIVHPDSTVNLQTILIMKDGSYYHHNTILA
jgi:hypothetical protein